MVSDDSGVFIDTAKLDLSKYANRPSLGKALFHYLLYVTNDTLKALELAEKATGVFTDDWWWQAMRGVCYYRLNMLRDAERQYIVSLVLSSPSQF